MKNLLILLIICSSTLLFGQNDFCQLLGKVDSLYCNEEWSEVINLLDEYDNNLKNEVFYNEILVRKSWALMQNYDTLKAIFSLEQIVKSQRFYDDKTDFAFHSNCRFFLHKNQNSENCIVWRIGEPEQIVKYRALILLAKVAYERQEYPKALNYLSIID